MPARNASRRSGSIPAICEYLLPSTTASLRLPHRSCRTRCNRGRVYAQTASERGRAPTYTPARGGNAAVMKLALAAARATAFASRASGRGGGTTLPGRVLTALAPDAPRRLAGRLPRGCVLVSATNGKTTTCGLLAEVLRGRVQLARNSAGANLASGITSALAVRDAATAELGLFECDEAALPAIADQLAPSAIALGNLFRDQLDRYGELELVAARWRELVSRLAPETTLVVCADDPLTASIAEGRPGVVRYGI